LTDLLGPASLLAISAAIFGPLASWYAGRRDRSPIPWLALGALLGPIALVLLALAPPGRCPACDTETRGWPDVCELCGWPLAGRIRLAGGIGSAPRRGRWADAERVVDPVAPAMNEPIPLPIGRTPRATNAPRSSAMAAAGTRGPWPPEPRPHSIMSQAEVLATGVYFGGTTSLSVGMRYAIVRHEDRLRIMGPLDIDPMAVALEMPLAGLIATAIEDRLIISDGSRRGVALAMGSLAGTTSTALEALMTEHAAAASIRPASG
jgi:hypothetical protein